MCRQPTRLSRKEDAMRGGSQNPLERTLRGVEDRVLQEIWFGVVRAGAMGALCLWVVATSALWWVDFNEHPPPHITARVSGATLVVLGIASVTSVEALGVRRFRWCCAAAYCCRLASVIGIGAFWWLRTGPSRVTSTWLVAADVAMVMLCACWLALIITPVERSHPDMRIARSHSGRS